MKKLIFTFIFFACLANVSAQINVNSSGQVGIGDNPTSSALRIHNTISPTFVLEGIDTRLEIGVAIKSGYFANFAVAGDIVYRPLGTKHGLIFYMPNNFNDGSHYIKFGDSYNGGWFSILNNKKVVIDGKVGIGKTPTLGMLDVSGSIYSGGNIVLTSDERFKSEIKPLFDEKDKLYLLQGKSYKKIPLPTGITDIRYNENGEELPPAEREKIEFSEYGYLAQELKEVFPDLVSQDSEGYYGVNYIGLIPVIVEVLKDQRLEIEKQQEQIKQLVKLIDIKSINENAFAENGIESIPLLLQNTPNPFNQVTEIGYYIPKTVNSANIYIYDINGFQQKSISISERGKGAAPLQASTLKAGIYFYTLICDGRPVDTKQMILTR